MPNVIVKNTTAYSRTGQVTVGIPFPRAFNLAFGDTLVANNAKAGVSNLRTQWYGVGAAWDTGSYKYARVTFEVDLAPNEEKTVSITRATGSTVVNTLSFAPNVQMLPNLAGSVVRLNIEGVSHDVDMLSLINASNRVEGGQSGDFYSRHRIFTHLPATSDPRTRYIWTDIVIDIPSRLNQVEVYFRYGFYRFFPNMENSAGIDPVLNLSTDVTLQTIGPRTKFRWEEYKVPAVQQITATNRTHTLARALTPGESKMPAGSSVMLKGVFCFDGSDSSLADLEEPILAIAEDWKDGSNYPITGVMPPRPSYVTSDADFFNRSETLRANAEGQIKSYRHTANWPTLCNNPNTADAGTHGYRDYAYGIRGWPFMATANYNWIPLLEFTTQQQALRHNWYYGTDGEPVPPSDFQNAQVRFWNGTFNSTSEDRYRGFNRKVETSDAFQEPHISRPIYGPDKEHFTIKLHILQGLITMDWFSLEYAKMYTNYFYYANRPDAYFWAASAIENWGVPRAAGRVSENFAFLYEFTRSAQLKQLIEARLLYCLNLPQSALLDRSLHPGGTEVIRTSAILSQNNLPNGLGPLTHWRPWEDAQFVLGKYFLSQTLLKEDPNDSVAARHLEMARDVAETVISRGYFDGRSTSDYRFVTCLFNSQSEAAAFLSAIGTQQNVITATGLASGASGLIWMSHHDPDYGTFSIIQRSVRICMSNGSGTFQVGENIRLSTGQEGPINRVLDFIGGGASYAIQSPTNGYARSLTDSELQTLVPSTTGADPNIYVNGYFQYARWTRFYLFNLLQCAVVARLAAQENYYADRNTEIISLCDDYISYFNANYNGDNGDLNENFYTFAGYIVDDLLNEGSRTLLPLPLESASSLPSVTVTTQNNSINATATVDSTSILVNVSSAASIGTTTTDVQVTPQGASATILVGSAISSAGATATTAVTSEAVVTVPVVGSVYATVTLPGRRKYTTVLVGEFSSVLSTSTNAGVPANPGGAAPEIFHRVLDLNPAVGESSFVDYYSLQQPISPLTPLVGESIGLNGQTITSQGYVWQLPQATLNAYDIDNISVIGTNLQHEIGQASRGAGIRTWKVADIDSVELLEFIGFDNVLEGIQVEEEYALSTTTYSPSFNGEGALTSSVFLSPNRLTRTTQVGNGKVIEGAVTPLEKASSTSSPQICRDMQMYYNLAVGTVNSNLSQLDSWVNHPVGIPAGEHNITSTLKLNLGLGFDELYTYKYSSSELENLSQYYSVFGKSTVTFSSNETVSEFGGETTTLEGHVEDGTLAVVLRSTSTDLCVAFILGVSASANSLRNNTHLVFDTTFAEKTKQFISVESRDFFDPGAAIGDGEDQIGRITTWVGRRVNIAFGFSLDSISSIIRDVITSYSITPNVTSEGIYPYERPAII